MYEDDENVVLQIYELWCSISDIEIERIKFKVEIKEYCDKFKDKLLGYIKYSLSNRKEHEDQEAWTTTKGANALLTNLGKCTHGDLIDYITSIMGEFLASDKVQLIDSAMLIFGSVMDTIHEQKIYSIVVEALDNILGYLNHKSSLVRKTTAWVLERICEVHTKNLSKDKFETIIQVIIQNLRSNELNKKIIINMLNALHQMSQHYRSQVIKLHMTSSILMLIL